MIKPTPCERAILVGHKSGRSYFQVALYLVWLFALLSVLNSRPVLSSTVDDTELIVVSGLVSLAPDGQCSLLEALANADTDTATYADCPAGHGVDTIVLAPRATYTLTDTTNVQDGANGLPPITGSLTIHGNGARIQRSTDTTAPAFRILYVALGGSLTLENIEISNGQEAFGAGVYNCGALSVSNSTFAYNHAVGHDGQSGMRYGGGGGGGAGMGGAIFTHGALTIQNSTLSDNSAQGGNGGTSGINAQPSTGGEGGSGIPSLCNSPTASATIGGGGDGGDYGRVGEDGQFGGGGGGGGAATCEASPGRGGVGGFGGGDGEAGDYSCTFPEPPPPGGEGGGGGGFGGAIFSSANAVVSVTSSTIAENRAIGGSVGGAGYGGGVYNDNGQLTFRNSVIATNSVSSTIDSIVAHPDISGPLSSEGGNVVGNGTGSSGFGRTSDQIGTPEQVIDPLLGPLQDNGGWTATRFLQAGSLAINAAEPVGCPMTDQRGYARVGQCDSGAYEFGGYPARFVYLPVIVQQ